jgi:hypothetical protein
MQKMTKEDENSWEAMRTPHKIAREDINKKGLCVAREKRKLS